MSIKLADTLVPMADFPAAMAENINFSDGENLQEKLDSGSLGGEGGGNHITLTQAEYDALSDEEKESDIIYFISDAVEEEPAEDPVYIPDMYDRNSNGDIPVVPFNRNCDNMIIIQNQGLIKEGEKYDEDYVGGWIFTGADEALGKDKKMFNKVKVIVSIPGVLRIGIINDNIFKANPRYSDCLVKWLVADFVAYGGLKEYDIEDTYLEDNQHIFIECRAGESAWYYNAEDTDVKVGDVTYPAKSCTTGLVVADKLDSTTNNVVFKSQSVTSTSARTSFIMGSATPEGNFRVNYTARSFDSTEGQPINGLTHSLNTGTLNIGLYRRTNYSDTRHCKCLENLTSLSFVGDSTQRRAYAPSHQEDIVGKSIYAFKLDVHTPGNITIYHCKGKTTDSFKIIDKYTHYLRAKGLQTVHLPFDITLKEEDEYIAFGGMHYKSTPDNIVMCESRWYYGTIPSWMNAQGKTGFINLSFEPTTYPEKISNIELNEESSNYLNVELICRGDRKTKLENKVFSVTGDSITTFAGMCTTKEGMPAGNSAGDNAVYYPANGRTVNNVDATWWGILAKDNRMRLLRNDAWSGSRVSSSTGSTDTKCLCGKERYKLLCNTDQSTDTSYPTGRPEIIINMIGTNDLSGGVELGEEMFKGVMGSEDEYKTILSAFSLMCRRFAGEYSSGNVKIVHFIIPRGTDWGYANANGDTIADLSLGFERIAKAWGQYFIPLSYFATLNPARYKYWSCPTDSVRRDFRGAIFTNADGLHPNIMGMEIVADGVHRYLNQIV